MLESDSAFRPSVASSENPCEAAFEVCAVTYSLKGATPSLSPVLFTNGLPQTSGQTFLQTIRDSMKIPKPSQGDVASLYIRSAAKGAVKELVGGPSCRPG